MLENEANIENNSSNHKIASLIHLALNLASTKTIIRKEDIMKYGKIRLFIFSKQWN